MIIPLRRLVAMKNKKLIILALPLFLASCAKTNELYKPTDYNDPDFDANYYTEQNNVDKVDVLGETIFNAPSNKVFLSNPSYNQALDGLKGDDQYIYVNGEKKLLDWMSDTPISDISTGYGPTKCLSEIDKSFANGYLSKLYDGRVRCDGYYQLSRVQLTESGYSSFFPKELVSAKYFGMSLFNKTTANANTAYRGCYLNMDLTISFYQHTSVNNQYNKYTVKINSIDIPINTGGSASLLLFYFEDIFGSDYSSKLEGVTAMSFSYKKNSILAKDEVSQKELISDLEKYGEPSTNKDEKSITHSAMMLYEVLLPDSSWR